MRQFTAVLNNHPWLDYVANRIRTRYTKSRYSLCKGFAQCKKNYNGLENRLQDLVGYTDERLKRGLGWLSMIVTMAPLLGLLGTVLGMIRAFAVVGGDIGAPTIIHRWCIRSLGSYCYRPYGGHHCSCLSQLLCSKGE